MNKSNFNDKNISNNNAFLVLPVLQTNKKLSEGESHLVEEVRKNNELCTLCEDFASEALNYLSENKTQTEIISILHKSCFKIPTIKQQCIVLVDYYAPLFFLEVSNIQPESFCQKVDLCEQAVSISQQLSKNACDICHHAVTEALLKLKDPDTQLEIIELLLKACNSVEGYAKKCKRLVFEYGPLILVNAEQFLEKNDVCIALHACASTAIGAEQEALPRTQHSAS
ncbi:Prosaposin [Olea europaea subsp. europaea]|uniref:Pulmonary surfactant-associated protein B n=1 Tax=Olea europaea subsp. europaea TaxID=158383 RepID=A0A8S0SRX7_OLEEU|nr:Prosaposin [Olea europaea subsp. europaea]